MLPSVRSFAPLSCLLGEGLIWDSEGELIWLVDIEGHELIRINLETRLPCRITFPEPVSWVLLTDSSDEVLVGMKSGIGRCQVYREAETFEWINQDFPGDPRFRLNDAKVDKFGRIWAGSMGLRNEYELVGNLAVFSSVAGLWTDIDTGYIIPNGPAFNRECTLALHSDSSRGTVFKYDLDPYDGSVLKRSVWLQTPKNLGLPDGMTFDSEDHVWIAHWGIGQVRRYDPLGRLVTSVILPVSNVTNVCFAGQDLDRLFVSTARSGLSLLEQHKQPMAGYLFEVTDPGATGVLPWRLPSASLAPKVEGI